MAIAYRVASDGYRRREPEATPLYRVLAKHLSTFLAEADAGHTSGLPAFVRRALAAFLDCGILARGFARVRCTGCGDDLCRDAARPAIAAERLHELPDGRIAYALRHTWSDGTTRVVFEPPSFLEKLAALIPPPRAHQVTYHGVLAPAAAWRSRIVPGPSTSRRRAAGGCLRSVKRRYDWADLLRRVLAVDVLCCGLCGGRRELIAQITQPGVVLAILSALGLPAEAPTVLPARGPPELF